MTGHWPHCSPLSKKPCASSPEQLRNRAAHTIIQAMRSHTARQAESAMLRTGEMWQTAAQVLSGAGLLAPENCSRSKRMSAANLFQLRQGMAVGLLLGILLGEVVGFLVSLPRVGLRLQAKASNAHKKGQSRCPW